MNTNEHYVSQVLQRRFANKGFLECFDLTQNIWKRVHTRRIFSRIGYSQLLLYGQHDSSVDESFQKCENALNTTLAALDEAANHKSTELPEDVRANLFWYCSHLWCLSPFMKRMAPFWFAMQLDLDLQSGRTALLEKVGIKQEDIVTIRLQYAQGKKFIPVGRDYDQLMFRIQFTQKCQEIYGSLRHCDWTLYNSPVIMPLTDTPFFSFSDHGIPLYIFTISPSQVLIGKFPPAPHTASEKTIVETDVFAQGQAEHVRDVICLSALTAVASPDRSIDVLAARKRAEEKGITFPKLTALDSALSAGLKEFNDLLRIMPVSEADYTKFKKSFVETLNRKTVAPAISK